MTANRTVRTGLTASAVISVSKFILDNTPDSNSIDLISLGYGRQRC